MVQSTYKWLDGARVKANAQAIGEELEKIRQKNKGKLTPPLVVENAKNKTSPLHRCFEWDDSKAAQQFRIQQANYMIRCIVVVYEENGLSQKKPIKAFVSLKDDNDKSFYTSMYTAMSNDEMREQVLRLGYLELVSWQRKYQSFREFAKIFVQIKRLKIKIKT